MLTDLKLKITNLQKKNNILLIKEYLKNVHRWEYSTKEYYNLLPYYHLLNKEKKGRLLKNMTIEKWNYQDLFRFGFDENNKMIISEQHIDADIRKGLYISLYEYSKHGYNKTYFKYYPTENENTPVINLISISKFEIVNNENSIYVGVNIYGDSSTIEYFYDNNKLIKVIKTASRWKHKEEYNLFYNKNEELYKIILGNTIYWQNQK